MKTLWGEELAIDAVLDALFGSALFWAFAAALVLFAVIGGVIALAGRAEQKREQKRYSAKAYEQLRVRQEFKRIIAEEEQ